eukprot:gnl/Dysnectes_brevis/2166_a2522_2069.p1 GENE.gnl/Dysnectes_brevis/2166_a2522_2069~~gnl/Dysnectes_brevis/2166_a2522_2069.p1  ORF type:complete len:246 (+),score=26.87 gnl/Dysnectes_brevis/2166_a2522_2069:92-739(+)
MNLQDYTDELQTLLQEIDLLYSKMGRTELEERNDLLTQVQSKVDESQEMLRALDTSISQLPQASKGQALAQAEGIRQQVDARVSQMHVIRRNIDEERVSADLRAGLAPKMDRELTRQQNRLDALDAAVNDAHVRTMETAELHEQMDADMEAHRVRLVANREKGRAADQAFRQGGKLTQLMTCTERRSSAFMCVFVIAMVLACIGLLYWTLRPKDE